MSWAPNPRTDQEEVDAVQLLAALLDAGADPNARQAKRFNNRERNFLNRVGATPYLLAAKHADAPLMRLLAAHGADTQQPTEGNASPLMVAAGVGIFNLGESAGTNEEAFEAVTLAYELGCKGITVYRYGSKQQQVLHLMNRELVLRQGVDGRLQRQENHRQTGEEREPLPLAYRVTGALPPVQTVDVKIGRQEESQAWQGVAVPGGKEVLAGLDSAMSLDHRHSGQPEGQPH